MKEESLQRSSSGSKGQGFNIKKTGDATVVLVGFPSVGKSTLLNEITNAESKVGAYQFTTLDIVPFNIANFCFNAFACCLPYVVGVCFSSNLGTIFISKGGR